MAITIEPGAVSELPVCDCCGGRTRIVRGFVSSDDTARAVYLVRWAPGRPEHDADVVVSIGGFCDADLATERRFVALKHRVVDGKPQFMVIDGPRSVWQGEQILGRGLTRKEALASLSKEAFAILDAAAEQDARLSGWLLDGPGPPP